MSIFTKFSLAAALLATAGLVAVSGSSRVEAAPAPAPITATPVVSAIPAADLENKDADCMAECAAEGLECLADCGDDDLKCATRCNTQTTRCYKKC
jgi:hypothetical protein